MLQNAAAAAAAKSLQSCPTLCDPIDGSPPGSPIPGILQARTLEWLPFPSPMQESAKWKWSCSVVSDCVRPHGPQPTRLLHPWDFPGKSTGVGCHSLLQHRMLGYLQCDFFLSLFSPDCLSCSQMLSNFLFYFIHILKLFLPRVLEKAMAPHSSTVAWKIPWAEEPGRLQPMGSLGVGHH